MVNNLSKPRRRRQLERRQAKGLMSKTIAVHVRYKSLYICFPCSAKQQREMSKFCVVCGTGTTTANFVVLHLELNAVVAYLQNSLSTFLEPLVYRADLDNRNFAGNYNFTFH